MSEKKRKGLIMPIDRPLERQHHLMMPPLCRMKGRIPILPHAAMEEVKDIILELPLLMRLIADPMPLKRRIDIHVRDPRGHRGRLDDIVHPYHQLVDLGGNAIGSQ